MARKNVRIAGNKRPTRRMPGWLWLLVALGLGLLVAAYVYLAHHRHPKPPVNTAPVFKEGQATKRVHKPASKPEAKGAVPEERFEFYRMLPNMQVVIPQQETGGAAPPATIKSQTTSPATAAEIYILQAGSFQRHEDAEHLKAKLALLGIEARIETALLPGNETRYRVQCGPYRDLATATKSKVLMQESGLSAVLMKVSG